MLQQNWRIIIYNVYLQFLGNSYWDLEGEAVEDCDQFKQMLNVGRNWRHLNFCEMRVPRKSKFKELLELCEKK